MFQRVVFLSRDRLVSELPVANQKRGRDAKGKRMFRAQKKEERSAQHAKRRIHYLRQRDHPESFRKFSVFLKRI